MTRARLFGALLLVGTLLAAAAPPVEADPTFSIGATTVTPNPVQPGVTIAIRTSITNTSATVASGLIIDEEIWDAAGVKVNQGTSSGQYYTPGQTLQPGETKPYEWFWTIPPSLTAGVYTVRIGVFQDHWTKLGSGSSGDRRT